MLYPWKYHTKAHKPKTFALALRLMIDSENYTLTERTLAFAASVSRRTVYDWLESRSWPSERDLKDIASAFILNRENRVLIQPRNQLLNEFKRIIDIDKLKRGEA